MHRCDRDRSGEPNIYMSWSTSELHLRVGLVPLNVFSTRQYFYLLTFPRWCFICGFILLFEFHFCLRYAVLPVPCSLVIIGWVKAELFALLCVGRSGVFVTFPYGVPGQVWYLIVSIALIVAFLSTTIKFEPVHEISNNEVFWHV